MIPANDLTDFDYEILEKVAANSAIEESSLVASFPEQAATTLRINLLEECDYYERPNGRLLAIEGTTYLEREYVSVEDENHLSYSTYTGRIKITPRGLKVLEEWRRQKKKEHRKLVEWRITKYAPIVISIIALIVAIISLLQSLHWIHLEQSEILPVPPSQVYSLNSTDNRSSTQLPQSP